jgi:hypothetical protein
MPIFWRGSPGIGTARGKSGSGRTWRLSRCPARSRQIGVSLHTEGAGYAGTYVGSRTGPAGLSGLRSGDAFELSIHWAKPVNGDRQARMRVELTDDGAMRMITIDADPKTGKNVVTSQVELRRG